MIVRSVIGKLVLHPSFAEFQEMTKTLKKDFLPIHNNVTCGILRRATHFTSCRFHKITNSIETIEKIMQLQLSDSGFPRF